MIIRRILAVTASLLIVGALFGCSSKDDIKNEAEVTYNTDKISNENTTTRVVDKTTDFNDETTTQKQTQKPTETTTQEQTQMPTEKTTTAKKQTEKENTTNKAEATTKNKATEKATITKEETTTKKEVNVGVTGVVINKTNITLSKGETTYLEATVKPTRATDKSVSWSSSNTSVATVSSSGKVTAVGNGTATIQVKTSTGNRTAICTITVSPKYASVEKLSEREKELLPYCDNGWTYVKNGSYIDIYYLGEKATYIKRKPEWDGKTYEIMMPGSYGDIVTTDNHKMFMVADDNSYYGDHFVFVYDLDTDEYKRVYRSLKKEYVATYGSFEGFITDGKDVYMLFRGSYQKMNVLKYNENSNEFDFVNTFAVDMNALLTENFVYCRDENVWRTEAHDYYSSVGSYAYALVTLDIKNSTITVDTDNLGQGIAVGTKFSMYQREKGIVYYWNEVVETNVYTDSSTVYEELRRLNTNTGVDDYLYRVNRGFEDGLKFIGAQGIVVGYGHDGNEFVYNENTGLYTTCKGIIGSNYEDGYDMWNCYYNGKAYPIW